MLPPEPSIMAYQSKAGVFIVRLMEATLSCGKRYRSKLLLADCFGFEPVIKPVINNPPVGY